MIFDISGNKLIQESFNQASKVQKAIDISALAKGNYIIKLATNNGSLSERLVK